MSQTSSSRGLGWLLLFNAAVFGVATFWPGAGLSIRILLAGVALGWLIWGVGLLARGRWPNARRWATWGMWLLLGSGLVLMAWQTLHILGAPLP